MKKFVLALLVSVIGFISLGAQTVVPNYFHWTRIVCDIIDKTTRPSGRSVVYVPQLYYSSDYLSVQPGVANYDNVQIIVANSQGETVKNDIMQVTAGGENLYYIGDLDSGSYEVAVEFDNFTLVGEFSF